jgi:hypothetical protein
MPMRNGQMKVFPINYQTVEESSDCMEYLIPGNWMLFHTQKLEGISFFVLPKGGKPLY